MKTKNMTKGTAVSLPFGIALGLTVSLVITVISAAVLSWLVLNGGISDTSLGYFIMGVLVLSSMLGAILSAAKIKRRWIFVCSLTGAAFYIALLASTAVFFGGNYRGMGVSALMVAIGSFLACLLGLVTKKGPVRAMKKYRPR